MKKILTFLLILFISLSMFSCTNQEDPHDVYVTVYPLKYIAEEILDGTEYSVGIVPGVSSHETSVDWSPKEIIAMTEAAYLFYVGANYDRYIDYQITSIFAEKEVTLVKFEDEPNYIQFIQGVVHVHEDDSSDELDDHSLGLDPHFWISPLKVKQVSQLIYDKLLLKFSDPIGRMALNYENLCNRLQELSDDYQEAIGNATNMAMTSTNLYGYLREDYGFDYLSISPGYHEESEQFTSLQKEEIVQHAVENNIRYIIYEMYTTSPLSNALFTELESLDMNPIKLEFNILQSLSDEDVANGNDYITVMYDNLALLELALGTPIE
ncbi:MAG: zinc ABC transporter substrate-binding protein [Tenericutes bacterium]|nr:zinc ABC transporter substrate-binding protein [Mycoplasmatota bacterium]